jgi:hypothetical protein
MASNLDQQQIMQLVFDEKRKRLAVDATVVAKITDAQINADDSDIGIRDSVSGNSLSINPDGSINSNVAVDSAEDSITIFGTETGAMDGTKRALRVDSKGNSKSLVMNSLVPYEYNGISFSYPDTFTEVFTYTQNGITVSTVTVTYTDSTKTRLASVART